MSKIYHPKRPLACAEPVVSQPDYPKTGTAMNSRNNSSRPPSCCTWGSTAHKVSWSAPTGTHTQTSCPPHKWVHDKTNHWRGQPCAGVACETTDSPCAVVGAKAQTKCPSMTVQPPHRAVVQWFWVQRQHRAFLDTSPVLFESVFEYKASTERF